MERQPSKQVKVRSYDGSTPVCLSRWVLVVIQDQLNPTTNLTDADIALFGQRLMAAGRRCGLQIEEMLDHTVSGDNREDIEFLTKAAAEGECELIVFIQADNCRLHNVIKEAGIRYRILTQDIRLSRIVLLLRRKQISIVNGLVSHIKKKLKELKHPERIIEYTPTALVDDELEAKGDGQDNEVDAKTTGDLANVDVDVRAKKADSVITEKMTKSEGNASPAESAEDAMEECLRAAYGAAKNVLLARFSEMKFVERGHVGAHASEDDTPCGGASVGGIGCCSGSVSLVFQKPFRDDSATAGNFSLSLKTSRCCVGCVLVARRNPNKAESQSRVTCAEPKYAPDSDEELDVF